MTRIHLPHQSFGRCNVPGCDLPGVRHHASYRSNERWSCIGICPMHHEALHALYDRIRDADEVELPVFTLRYILNTKATEAKVVAMDPRVPRYQRRAVQLTFADLMGRSGDYWRSIQATELRPIDELPHDDEAPPKAA